MRLRYGFLCEYAGEMVNRTNMVVGIFDGMVIQRSIGEPVAVMPHVIFATVEDSSVSAPRHLMGFRLVNADGATLFEAEMPFNIGTGLVDRPGIAKAANVTCRVGAIAVPESGQFEWVILVDGERMGSIPFTVDEIAPALTS